MLSLGIEGCNVVCLSTTFGNKSCILRFRLVKVRLSINTHDSNLLVSVDQELLSISLGSINLGNSVSLNLIDYNLLHTLSIGDENRCLLLSLGLGYLLVGIGLKFLLLLVNLCTSDLLFKLVEFSLVHSLQVSELLLFLIVKGKFLILLLLLVILQLDLKTGLFLESTDQLRVHDYVGDVTLFKLDSIWCELHVQVGHHGVGHI